MLPYAIADADYYAATLRRCLMPPLRYALTPLRHADEEKAYRVCYGGA